VFTEHLEHPEYPPLMKVYFTASKLTQTFFYQKSNRKIS